MLGDAMTTLGILVGSQGRGSNMKAIATACAEGEIAARVGVVVSPKGNTPAVETAHDLGLSVAIVSPAGEHYAQRLVDELDRYEVDWVCLAGYMRLLPIEVLQRWPNRVLNIHPALLPKFGGKGMFGHHVHEAVIAAGETESGCSVHRVSEEYDKGEVLLQMRCPVLPQDTPESLAARVLELEHHAYPMAIRQVMDATG
ncbi:MAG: phosphoribosylglycinamide formyltransferase [Fimbriimonadales bacterium]